MQHETTSKPDLEPWVRLCLTPEIGPVLGHRLLAYFGAPGAVFEAGERELERVEGLGVSRRGRLREKEHGEKARAEMKRCLEAGVRLICLADADYPALLLRLAYPPLLLWVEGRLAPEDRLAVALVGPRTASIYGKQMTGLIAGPLAGKGLTIVSGMAHGVDVEAHRAAMDGGGRTLAVLGQGLGTAIHPQRNAPVARRIVEEERGALISIFPIEAGAQAGNFPRRNEIIAGLSLGVLVVEAGEESGSLITARHALENGRVVMACPGDATRRAAQGSNRLIAEGAALVQRPEDVLEALSAELRREMEALGVEGARADRGSGVGAAAKGARGADGPGGEDGGNGPDEADEWGLAAGERLAAAGAALEESELERAIMAMIREEPLPSEVIVGRCAESGWERGKVLEALLEMEIGGRVRPLPGRIYGVGRL